MRKVMFPRRAPLVHIGSGPAALPGWLNVDRHRYPGVDMTLDVRNGLPFRDVRFVFAEHFIEHLNLHEAMYFLRECRRVLRDEGILRVSTPNLDWVWATHYAFSDDAATAIDCCFKINRGFHAWGHQFLYNEPTLTALLHDAGFARVRQCGYGSSEYPELRGLERHERDEDHDGLSDLVILEASGTGGIPPPQLSRPRGEFLEAFGAK
jgi:SAM-dependent methyltransferase